jgi:hypothetical protein
LQGLFSQKIESQRFREFIPETVTFYSAAARCPHGEKAHEKSDFFATVSDGLTAFCVCHLKLSLPLG